MNQKKLNQYLKYIMSLSDKERELFYSKNEFRFSNKEVLKRLKEPLKKIDKSPYREIELSGWWDKVFAPQATIHNISNVPIKLHNGITIKKLEKENKMKIPYKGEVKRKWISMSKNNISNLSNEILYNRIVESIRKEGREITFEQVKEIIEEYNNTFNK